MILNERIKKLRKVIDLTQQEFADRIGATQNTIAGYESGRRKPSNTTINSICRIFDINEDWLRNGTGEMFIVKSRDEEIAEFIGNVQFSEDDTFKKKLISMLAKLDESEWILLEKMANKLYENKKD